MEAKQRILSERLERCYSGAVYDVLRAMGYPNQVLPHHIGPLQLDQKLAGPVYTVSGRYDVQFDPHETLLSWTAFLSKAPSDTVVICQPNDRTLSHMGELSAETLQGKGVRGYIVDGGCRDSAFIREIGFKVFCSYLTPVDIVGRWKAQDLGAPITIGDVKIATEDYVMADHDGIVIIPQSIAEDVVIQTEEVLKTESLVRKAILAGMDPQEAYLKYGKF
ncbi:MAG: RraA family protein [Saprospiraceae bacterium]|nr:RraA family protein [Saprospiraceae bacterium]